MLASSLHRCWEKKTICGLPSLLLLSLLLCDFSHTREANRKHGSLGFLSHYLWFLGITVMIIPKLGELFCYSILLVLSYSYNNEQFSFMQPSILQATENFLAAHLSSKHIIRFPVSHTETVWQHSNLLVILNKNHGIHMTSKKLRRWFLSHATWRSAEFLILDYHVFTVNY